jgi:hypothetical protein
MARNRRYDIEFMLNPLIIAKYHGRQKDLRKTKLPSEPVCNLYIVSRAPRITVDPKTVQFTTSGELFAVLRQQIKGSFKEYPIHIERFDPDAAKFKWQSEWPYDELDMIDAAGKRRELGSVSIFFRQAGMLPRALMNQEVLYIGQAFGKTGERNAYDRLKNHSTLQRIYSENSPDQEIWLTLCSIDDVMLNTVIGKPGGVVEKTKAESDAHFDRVYERYNSPDFWNREVVTGAEAGLIYYFKPAYNLVYKDNFLDPTHAHMAALFELEFHTVIIELQSIDVKVSFGSALVAPKNVHIVHYPLGELADIFNFGSG